MGCGLPLRSEVDGVDWVMGQGFEPGVFRELGFLGLMPCRAFPAGLDRGQR